MPFDFTDNGEIWDNPESVTLISVTPSDTSISVSRALRLPLSTREVANSNGVYTSQDCRWILPGSLLTAAQSPRPRWRIQSTNEYGDTVDWTIIDRSYSTMTDLFRCTCRDLVLVNDLRDSISVLRPTNTKNAAGIRVPTYDQTPYSSIAAKIQEVDSEVSDDLGKQSLRKRFVCYVSQDLTVTKDDRVTCSGTTYQIVGYRNASRIDALFEMDLEIMP